MLSGSINRFTSIVLNQLIASQNATTSIVLHGISLFSILNAINVGLMGRSLEQLSRFLDYDVEKRYDLEYWINSDSAYQLINLGHSAEETADIYSYFLCPCELYDRYKEISRLFCRIHHLKVNYSNFDESNMEINKRISRENYGLFRRLFIDSEMSENKIVVINKAYFNAYWQMRFDDSLTKRELFFDENGLSKQVNMMNQKNFERLYDSPHYIFRILFKQLSNENLVSAIILPRDGHSVDEVLKILNVFVEIDIA
ncbi:Glia-derived nexin [Thelohanellus kitauei]|uniref:Glia-derived nexin n=1 Tax=Thelohanellus kitauei TaxID=669202 RepID=A0A0C2MVG6_THEKT|nr:Glia-derived nexin [Thelohanellus kitauei]